jgi:NAD(P)-dependent dehydrogenase (short-subunit alcohol dehydrogenase family)
MLCRMVDLPDGENPRCAVVTGAAGAIGRGICLELASAGFAIAAVDLEAPSLASLDPGAVLGRDWRTYACDVTEPRSVEAAIAQIHGDAGRIDVLVNCAGVVHVDPFLELPFETWRHVMSVNADGTFLVGQAVARHMINQDVDVVLDRRGMIVNIASAAADVGRPTRAAYAASKAVVRHLTWTEALALGPHQVAACVVFPGEVIEGMLYGIYEEIARASSRDVSEVIAEAERDQPTGRFQTAREVGQRVSYCATSQGMSLNGATLWCDAHVDPIPPS